MKLLNKQSLFPLLNHKNFGSEKHGTAIAIYSVKRTGGTYESFYAPYSSHLFFNDFSRK